MTESPRGRPQVGHEPDPVRGERVLLRPVRPEDRPVLELWASDRHRYQGEFNDLGGPMRTGLPPGPAPHPEPGTAADPGPDPDLGPDPEPGKPENGGLLIVERRADCTPIGTVSWHPVTYGPNPQSKAWNFGIALIPEARGHGLGVEAQRLLVAYLFASTDAHRLEATTDVQNLPEQRALEKAGLRREGVARGAQFRAGAWHDLVLYARLRSDG